MGKRISEVLAPLANLQVSLPHCNLHCVFVCSDDSYSCAWAWTSTQEDCAFSKIGSVKLGSVAAYSLLTFNPELKCRAELLFEHLFLNGEDD